jgi:hypothetical protein
MGEDGNKELRLMGELLLLDGLQIGDIILTASSQYKSNRRQSLACLTRQVVVLPNVPNDLIFDCWMDFRGSAARFSITTWKRPFASHRVRSS